MRNYKKKFFTLFALVAVASANAAIFTETENNNTLTTGNVFTGVQIGDSVTGTTTGTSTTTTGLTSADYYQLQMATQAPAIYFNQITLTTTGTAGHSGAIMGVGVSLGVIGTTASAIQSSLTTTTPARMNNWYSFGSAHTVDYRVTGTTSTTAAYNAAITQSVVTPTDLGTVGIGALNINTTTVGGTTTDTELFLYDSNFNLIQWNDDIDAGSGGANPTSNFNSRINANLAVGTYFIALGRFNTAANVVALDQDTNLAPSGAGVLRSGNMLSSSSSNSSYTAVQLNFGTTTVANTSFGTVTPAQFGEVKWYSVQAVPEPGSMIAISLGLAALARRKKNA